MSRNLKYGLYRANSESAYLVDLLDFMTNPNNNKTYIRFVELETLNNYCLEESEFSEKYKLVENFSLEDKYKILKAAGWQIECESPFEIRHSDGSFATNQAASIVSEYIKDNISDIL